MYEYSILYKSSSAHANANALSRLPRPSIPPDPPLPPEIVLVLEQMAESPVTVDQIRLWSSHFNSHSLYSNRLAVSIGSI